jgi:hypothetical protein
VHELIVHGLCWDVKDAANDDIAHLAFGMAGDDRDDPF